MDKFGKTIAAVQGPQRLTVVIFEVGKAVGNQTVVISELKRDVGVILEKCSALQRNMDIFGDQSG